MRNQTEWNELHNQNRFRPKYPEDDVVRWLFSNFPKEKKYRILDDGCGAGRHIMLLADNDYEPYGVDYSANGVKYTKELLKQKGFQHYVDNIIQCSCESLPYDNDFFDGVISFGVLYYLSEEGIKKAVEEIYRVLKRSGKTIVVVRNKQDYRYKGESDTIEIENENLSGFYENNMQEHFFSRDELLELFRDFDDVVIERIIRTHNNETICDNDYVVYATK